MNFKSAWRHRRASSERSGEAAARGVAAEGFSSSFGEVGRDYEYPETGFVEEGERVLVLVDEHPPLKETAATGAESKEMLDRTYARK